MKTKLHLSLILILAATQLGFGQWVQQGSDIDGEAVGDNSGWSVSLSADGLRLAVAGRYNDGDTGDPADNRGHVRVYRRQGGAWIQLGSDIDGEVAGDNSGFSVSLNGNGSYLAVGAVGNDESGNNSGHVRVYQFDGINWIPFGSDIDGEAADDEFGESVSLSADGLRLAVGARYNDDNGIDAGHVRVYGWDVGLGNWVQLGADIDGEAAGDESGYSVSLSADGSRLAVGGWLNDGFNGADSGHARVYEWNGMSWDQLGTDLDGEAPVDEFGHSVSLSADGSRLAVGGRYNDDNGDNSGHVRVYEWDGLFMSWDQLGADLNGEGAGDNFGHAVNLSADGSFLAVGARFNNGNGTNSGHVRVYEYDGANWNQTGSDLDGEAVDDNFGQSVSLSSDGIRLAVGARFNDGGGTNSGHARVFFNADLETNMFVGHGSGDNNTGDNNAFLGDYSGADNTEGSDNTFVGYQSGYSNTEGSGNVFLGHQAGYNNETNSNQLYIDNSDTSSPLIWGDFANDILRFNGNVVIGNVDNPEGYNLYVETGILTEKVKIAVSADMANWSDYVFEDDYLLKPLTEVEEYVKQNKHLPGIPSSEEVTKEGIDVAQMDAKLLEKIEELTLYTIQQDKTLRQQQKQIQLLQKQLNELKEQFKND